MDKSLSLGYASRSQIIRRITEAWGETNLYCAACSSQNINRHVANTEAADFYCSLCSASYQMKASNRQKASRIPDGAYLAMMRAPKGDSVPNLLLLHYSDEWRVENLTLIPSFFFSSSAIEKRKPLSSTARRAGWVGCNILLNKIAPDGKIALVTQGVYMPPERVRNHYETLRPLKALGTASRGWTLDVLQVVRRIGRTQFTLADVYKSESYLSEIYPNNRNIRPKIRQQLQILRDLEFIHFDSRGNYRLTR